MPSSWIAQRDALTFGSIFGAVLGLAPLYWHARSWSVGQFLFGFWLGSMNLMRFINLVVWRNTSENLAPAWCEIYVRFTLAGGTGIASATLAGAHRVAAIASGTHLSQRLGEKRVVITDLSIGLTLPIIQLVAYYFMQDHRFDVFEDVGCTASIPNTLLFIFLNKVLPVIVSIAASIYCLVTFLAIRRRQKSMEELICTNTELTVPRYLRLMTLCFVIVAGSISLSTSLLVADLVHDPIVPWSGLNDFHHDYGRIGTYPRSSEDWIQKHDTQFGSWVTIALSVGYFCFFISTQEARGNCLSVVRLVIDWIGSPRHHDSLQNHRVIPKAPQISTIEFRHSTIRSDAESVCTVPQKAILTELRPLEYSFVSIPHQFGEGVKGSGCPGSSVDVL